MDNEKDILNAEASEEVTDAVEETTEVTEEVIEEVIEEVTEDVAEDAAEETAEEAVEVAETVKKTVSKVYLCSECGKVTDEDVCPVCQKEMTKEEAYVCKSHTEVEKSKKTTKMVVTIVVALAVIVAAIFGGLYIYKEVYNPYNHGEYKDLAFGQTLGELAEEEGMVYEKYLDDNGYPADMPKSTYYYVAMQLIPMGELITPEQLEMYGMTLDDFFAEYGLGEAGFDEKTTRGEFEGAQTMKDYFVVETEEDLASIIEQNPELADLGLTLDTKFKDVRTEIYKVIESRRVEAEEEEAAAEEESEETAEEAAEEEVETEEAAATEVPVEEAPAEEAPAEEAPAEEVTAEETPAEEVITAE